MSLSRRTFLVSAMGAALSAFSRTARAEAGVPLQLQAQLVSKIGTFDRNFPARAGSVSRVVVLHKATDPDSVRVAASMAKALAALREIGGFTTQVVAESFPGVVSLAERFRSSKPALVYFATGLQGDMEAIGKALSGIDVLSIGATASDANHGVVVAFDLEEGRPKIVVNLARARAQNVAFKAELLKLARIVG